MTTRKTISITEDDVRNAAKSKRILFKKESSKPQKSILAADDEARLIHAIRMDLFIGYGKINLEEICKGNKEKEDELIKYLHRRLSLCRLPPPGRVFDITLLRKDPPKILSYHEFMKKSAEERMEELKDHAIRLAVYRADIMLNACRRSKTFSNDYINTEVCRIIWERDEEIFCIQRY